MTLEGHDRDLRYFIYKYFAAEGEAPSNESMQRACNLTPTSLAQGLRRLADAHALALHPETGDIWMAHPFSAVETPYRVTTARQEYWANCAWDVLGVAALLGEDVDCKCMCPECGSEMTLAVTAGQAISTEDAVIHFVVRPAQFWDDVGYT